MVNGRWRLVCEPLGLALLALVATGGCSLQPACPSNPEALASADPASLEGDRGRRGARDDLVAATAIVNRFVSAADPQYRGYDIEIVARFAGLDASEQFMFVRTDSELDTVDPGDEVFVFGEHGPQPAEISSAGGCPVLTPLDP